MNIPIIPVEAMKTDSQRESCTHFNALSSELKWFFENGVRVSVKWKPTGYEICFSQFPPSKRAAQKND